MTTFIRKEIRAIRQLAQGDIYRHFVHGHSLNIYSTAGARAGWTAGFKGECMPTHRQGQAGSGFWGQWMLGRIVAKIIAKRQA